MVISLAFVLYRLCESVWATCITYGKHDEEIKCYLGVKLYII